MLVRDVMTTDVVTVDVNATLDEVAANLLEHGIGSVVVVADGTPHGIVTETDVLGAAHDRGEPLADVPVRDLSRPPLVTTDTDRTVQAVARTMADEGVKKVPVTEDLDVVGIVTLTDIVWHLSEFRSEAIDLAERKWGPD